MIFFIYAAAFFMALDNFPFMFGGGYKPLSLLFLVIYVLLNLPFVFRIKLKKIEVMLFGILISAIIITLFLNIIFGYKFDGLIDATSSLGAGIVIYIAFKLFAQKHANDERKFIKLFVWMVRGYGLAVIIGVLQVIYIYVVHSASLYNIIHLFVNRDAFAGAGRVHFTFSEPSFISLHTNLLLLPSIIILKNKGYLTKSHKFIVFMFFLISLFSLSIRYFLDIFIFFILFSYFTTHKKLFVQRFVSFLFASILVVGLLNIIFIQNIFSINSVHYNRMSNTIKNPVSITEDVSFLIRSTYTKVGISSFLDRPFLGYGLGNFHYAYVDHFFEVDQEALAKSSELRGAVNNYSLSQYNMFTRMLSELGVIGIALSLLTLYYLASSKGHNFSKMMIILVVYSQLQFDSLAFIPLYFWIALLKTEFISGINIFKPSVKEIAPIRLGKYPK